MKKVLVTVLLLFTLSEVTMALRSAATSNRPAAAPRAATQGGGSVPVWLQGAYSQTGNTRIDNGGGGSNPTTPGAAPVPVRETKALRDPAYGGTYNPANVSAQSPAVPPRVPMPTVAPAPTPTRTGDGSRLPAYSQPASIPVWLRKLFDRDPAYGGTYNPANVSAQTTYGGTNPNPEVTQGTLRGTNQPFVVGEDSITQSPTSPYDSYNGVRFPQLQLLLSGRSNGQEVGAGTLDPSLWNPAAVAGSGGFGSSYGGNWRRGGGGGGGRGGGGSYDYANDYPAWVKTLMGLNSWNIK